MDQVEAEATRVLHLVKRHQVPDVLISGVRTIQVLDPRGRVVAATEGMADRAMTDFTPAPDNAGAEEVSCKLSLFPGRCMIVVAYRAYEADGDWIVIAADRMPAWYVHPAFIASLLAGSALLIALTYLVTSRTVSRTLAPVGDIRAKLATITSTDLGDRVPIPGHRDEISELSQTVNQTIERLGSLVEQQRRFASDASHDLRSPVTAMRAQVEAALLYPDEADWPKTGQALLDSLDRLQAIIADLLNLAQLDAPGARDAVDLSALIAAEVDGRPRKAKLVRQLAPELAVTGDRLRLARPLTNLLDNAERHADMQITVTARAEDQTAVVEVLDDGAGIAPHQREMIFQRFTRLDTARNKDEGGSGLGLAIARQIAETHGGTLTVEDSPRGARFVLRLPRIPDQDRAASIRLP